MEGRVRDDRVRRTRQWLVGAGWLVCAVAFTGCAAPSAERTEAAEATQSGEELPDASEQGPDRSERDGEEGDEESKSAEKGETDSADDRDQEREAESVSGSKKNKIERAVDLSEKGKEGRAERILKRFVDDADAGFLAAYNLGVIAEKKGDVKAAANYYTTALDENLDFSPALLNLVRLYIRNGRVRDADEIARKYIEKRPENLDHRAVRLEVGLARGQYREVIREAKKLLRRDERNVEAMLAMAQANYEMERYELSQAVLERARELAPERSEIFYLFGVVATENEERGRAISNFEKALELNPRFAEAHNNLGLLYQEAGDFEAAAEQFRKAIADYPEYKEARLNLGIALKQLEQKKKAEEMFKEVINMDSEYADAYFNLGVLYLDSEMPDMDKIPRLEKSIEYLNEYKRKAAGRLEDDDPANDYIASAREQIKAEKERQEMMRKTQQSAGSDGGGGSGGSSGSGEGTSEGSSE